MSVEQKANISPESKSKILNSIEVNIKDILTGDNAEHEGSDKWRNRDLYEAINEVAKQDNFSNETHDHIHKLLKEQTKDVRIETESELSSILKKVDPAFEDIDDIIESIREKIKDEYVSKFKEALRNTAPENLTSLHAQAEEKFNTLGYDFKLDKDGETLIIERNKTGEPEKENSQDANVNQEEQPETERDAGDKTIHEKVDGAINKDVEQDKKLRKQAKELEGVKSQAMKAEAKADANRDEVRHHTHNDVFGIGAGTAGIVSGIVNGGVELIKFGGSGIAKRFDKVVGFGADKIWSGNDYAKDNNEKTSKLKSLFKNTIPNQYKKARFKDVSRYASYSAESLSNEAEIIKNRMTEIANKKDSKGNPLSDDQLKIAKVELDNSINAYKEKHANTREFLNDNSKKLTKEAKKELKDSLNTADDIKQEAEKHKDNPELKDMAEKLMKVLEEIIKSLAKMFSRKKEKEANSEMGM